MRKEISVYEAKETYNIVCAHEIMDNNEKRFRLRCVTDGSAYIRTEASKIGKWQNSHFHESIFETYIVQKGWIAYATLQDDHPQMQIFNEGEVFTTKPNLPHNIYMSSESVIHTVKHGEGKTNDWIEYKKLDELIQHLDEKEIVNYRTQ